MPGQPPAPMPGQLFVSDPEPQSNPQSDPEPQSNPQSDPEPQSNPQSDPEPQSDPDPEPQSDPDPDSEPVAKRRKIITEVAFPMTGSQYHYRTHGNCPTYSSTIQLSSLGYAHCPRCICYICGLVANNCRSTSHAYAQEGPYYDSQRKITSSVAIQNHVTEIPEGYVYLGTIVESFPLVGVTDGIPVFAVQQFFAQPKPASYLFCLRDMCNNGMVRMMAYMEGFRPQHAQSNMTLMSTLTGVLSIRPLCSKDDILGTVRYDKEKSQMLVAVYHRAEGLVHSVNHVNLLCRLNRVSVPWPSIPVTAVPPSIRDTWTLMPHQQQALDTVAHVEENGVVQQLWSRYNVSGKRTLYRMGAGCSTLQMPGDGMHRGGIIDVARGYGKTLIAVTMVARDLERAAHPGPTLVVLPHGNLVHQWVATCPPALAVHVVNATSTPTDVSEAHLVIVVISRVTRSKRALPWGSEFWFHRVIIDESHKMIGTATGLTGTGRKLAELVRADIWWGLTGTPRGTSTSTLRGMATLMYPATSDSPATLQAQTSYLSYFVNTMSVSLTKAGVESLVLGTAVSPTVNQSRLPAITHVAQPVRMDPDDMAMYERVMADVWALYQDVPRNLMRAGNTVLSALNGTKPLAMIKLDQLDDDGIMPLLPEDQLDCVICMGSITHPIKTNCDHYFCTACIRQALVANKRGQCPLCRQDANPMKRCLQPLAADAPAEPTARVTTKKRTAILQKTKALLADNPNDSILVFSKCPAVRKALLQALAPDVASDNITRFQSDPVQRVLVLSTTSCAVGLHLIKANHVVLCEPSCVQDVGKQAVARAHRMGQHKPVFVYEFYCEGTIEQSIHARNASSAPGSTSFQKLFQSSVKA